MQRPSTRRRGNRPRFRRRPRCRLRKEYVMASRCRGGCGRRQFLSAAAGLVGAAAGAGAARADERPRRANPRATSGDDVGPDWEQRLTVTVGPRDADLVGSTDKVIQAAVDYAARLGGG